MTRENLKKVTAILQAYLDGKEIEFYSSDFNEWHTAAMTNIIGLIDNVDSYRIKPESKYRPFANAEECWNEMEKHQPFGWVKYRNGSKFVIENIDSRGFVEVYDEGTCNFKEVFENSTFVDGLPFGVKVEE